MGSWPPLPLPPILPYSRCPSLTTGRAIHLREKKNPLMRRRRTLPRAAPSSVAARGESCRLSSQTLSSLGSRSFQPMPRNPPSPSPLLPPQTKKKPQPLRVASQSSASSSASPSQRLSTARACERGKHHQTSAVQRRVTSRLQMLPRPASAKPNASPSSRGWGGASPNTRSGRHACTRTATPSSLPAQSDVEGPSVQRPFFFAPSPTAPTQAIPESPVSFTRDPYPERATLSHVHPTIKGLARRLLSLPRLGTPCCVMAASSQPRVASCRPGARRPAAIAAPVAASQQGSSPGRHVRGPSWRSTLPHSGFFPRQLPNGCRHNVSKPRGPSSVLFQSPPKPSPPFARPRRRPPGGHALCIVCGVRIGPRRRAPRRDIDSGPRNEATRPVSSRLTRLARKNSCLLPRRLPRVAAATVRAPETGPVRLVVRPDTGRLCRRDETTSLGWLNPMCLSCLLRRPS